MVAQVIQLERDSAKRLERVAEVVRKGGLILFPTETVYGLGCAADDSSAIERLYQLKQRNRAKPLALHLGRVEDLFQYALVSEREWQWIAQLLPGPYTLILRATADAPPVALSEGKVGIRVPQSPAFQMVAEAVGKPLAGTSANRGNEAPVVTPQEAIDQFVNQVELIIATSELPSGRSSSVIDLTEDPPRALRGELPKFIQKSLPERPQQSDS